MSYADNVKSNDDLDVMKCPHCGMKDFAQVMQDYTGYHQRETLIHCDNDDCSKMYIIVYKFSHIIKLVEEESKEGKV